ncbi:MAG: hypothetical protein ACXADB_02400 [Candidatus Hermodarchaeia archaeon]|jgi:hypothetical protein
MKLPVILASSVHRSSMSSKVHGGVYLVNLETGKHHNLQLSQHDINLHGRGGERGFRGLAFGRGKTYVGLHNGVQVYDQQFNLLDTIYNEDCFGSVHEICIFKDKLYVCSTNHDSIVVVNVNTHKTIRCITIKHGPQGFFLSKNNSPPPKEDSLHLNSVYVDQRGVFCSGTNISSLLLVKGDSISKFANTLSGTHNCQPYGNDKIICNYTSNNKLAILHNGRIVKSVDVKKIPKHRMTDINGTEQVAKQPFARGLAYNDEIIVGGSSPDMISVYEKGTLRCIKNINLSMNLTYCIHGLGFYPYKQDYV